MNRLVIDVTQLAEWQGRLTGIPRVMNELASRFVATGDNCELVIWDRKLSKFRSIAYKEAVMAAPVSAPSTTVVSSRGKARLRRIVKGVEARAPVIAKIRRRLYQPLTIDKAALSARPFEFKDGDALFVLWGSWHDQPYINALVALCQRGIGYVQAVYDMLPLVTPQFSGHSTTALDNYARTLYPRASLILAISKHTKSDLEQWLKINELRAPSIEVFRLGDDFKAARASEPSDQSFVKAGCKGNDYILVVGTIEARKNHALLYYTYKLAKERKEVLPKAVIVGRRGWLTDDIYTLMTTDPDTKDDFIFLQQASDEELSWLYDNCLFSLYPSFYEGWGLPVAESLGRGVPCVASNSSSIPEIAGNLIHYFSPLSADECLSAILYTLKPQHLAKARANAKEYRPTSWDETFQTVNTYINKELRS